MRRHEQHLEATLHKKLTVTANNQQIIVALDIVLDEDNPHALLSASDLDGNELAQVKVRPDFKLNSNSAHAWIQNDYGKPNWVRRVERSVGWKEHSRLISKS